MTVTLREITDENAESVQALRCTPDQEQFVSSVTDSLAEADKYPQLNPWFRAVYADEAPAGFVMLSWDVDPQPPEINGPWFLWKLLIDHRYQGKGYGQEVVRQIIELVRGQGAANCSPAMCLARAVRPVSTPGSDSSPQETWTPRERSSCARDWMSDTGRMSLAGACVMPGAHSEDSRPQAVARCPWRPLSESRRTAAAA